MATNSSLAILKAMGTLPSILAPAAQEQIRGFLQSQLLPEGAFANRFGQADLYYTSFGLAGAEALGMKLPLKAVDGYLKSQAPASLDLIHLHCYLRSVLLLRKLSMPALLSPALLPGLLRRVPEAALIPNFSLAGGYRIALDKPVTPYAVFLAVTAFSSCGMPVPEPARLLATLAAFRTPDGGWSNVPGTAEGTVNASAAALVTLAECGIEPDAPAQAWLLRQFETPSGGVHGVALAPLPDLLSTASALTALHVGKIPLPEARKKRCRDLVLDHWNADGGFTGTVADDVSDCEYTFYGLLALGILAS
jgi:hypothetical protein